MENEMKIVIERLKKRGVRFGQGLSDDALLNIEKTHNFEFPPDYKQFLRTARPISDGFTDWASDREIAEKQAWPQEGLLFDIDCNDYWYPGWGPKPVSLDERKWTALDMLNAYPKLIPIYSHRYIPASPYEAGNPVFSVHQMDIIYYGYDLLSYLAHEFGVRYPKEVSMRNEPKEIEFWSSVAQGSVMDY